MWAVVDIQLVFGLTHLLKHLIFSRIPALVLSNCVTHPFLALVPFLKRGHVTS